MELQPQPMNTHDPNEIIFMQSKLMLISRARSGTDWFFWIAGLSIINSIVFLTGILISLVVGLGTTQIIDIIASTIIQDLTGNSAVIVSVIAFSMDLAIAALFVVAGWLGRKRYRWAVIIGMVLYALDTLTLILLQSWFGLFFHGWALWRLWGGLQAINELNSLEKNYAAGN